MLHNVAFPGIYYCTEHLGAAAFLNGFKTWIASKFIQKLGVHLYMYTQSIHKVHEKMFS